MHPVCFVLDSSRQEEIQEAECEESCNKIDLSFKTVSFSPLHIPLNPS